MDGNKSGAGRVSRSEMFARLRLSADVEYFSFIAIKQLKKEG